jgi:type I restriction enzyme S subunit
VIFDEKPLSMLASAIRMGPFGSSIKKDRYVSEGVPVINGRHLHGVRLAESVGYEFLSEDHADELRNANARSGDVVVTHRGTLGQASLIPEGSRFDRYVISQSQLLIRCDPSTLDPSFLAYFLNSPLGRDRILDYATQTGVPALAQPSRAVAKIRVPVPYIDEQRAIAEVLGALDDKIAANTALAATAEQVLRAEIDAAWLRSHDRSSTLADFVELNPRVAVPRAESAIYVDMKRLPESGWSIDGFDYREPKGGARFQNGDTLLARITPCLENRKTGFVDHLPDGQVGIGSTEFIVLRARNDVAAPISFLLATATRFRDHAIQQMIGTSGRQRVAASDLASFEMPTPDPAWLADFGGRAVAIFQAVSAQSAENRTLAATRDALLPQLMSGKLRVRDAENAVAKVGV